MEDYPSLLDQLDHGPPVQFSPISGGCIAQAAIASFSDGFRVFIKRASSDPRMFECEAAGLNALRAAEVIRVPEVLAVSPDALVLEYIEPGPGGSDFFPDFGRRFAQMHGVRGEVCGFPHDNFIGSTPQMNAPVDSDPANWPTFFIERRLRFQAELATENGHGHELLKLLERGEANIYDLLAADKGKPSLLHGDLWSGNFMAGENGEACLIDPAVYYGHREADLAMTRLFGGFDSTFYAAYNEVMPVAPGWEDRLSVYQLYHLLNHLNLFGSTYYARSKQILEQY